MLTHKPRIIWNALFTLMCVCLLMLGLHAPAAQAKPNKKYASIVMDADTGMILQQRYADKKLHPASLTKIMTLLLTFEALERGEISLKQRVRISNRAASMVPSKLDLPPGSSIKVRDAIYALVTKSANDVAVALAEHIAGSEYSFAKRMTRRAHQLGMKKTRFINASGLHDPRQISTARDMAKLARAIIINYPSYYRYFSRASFTYRGKTYKNHNKLLGTYRGMDGMKTGYINASGFNLVASAARNNRRIIGVVFGGRTSKTRNAHMAELLDHGFSKIGRMRVAHKTVPTPSKKPLGQQNNYQTASSYIPAPQSKNAYRLSSYENPTEQGDSSPYATRRLETGLLAIAAHKRQRNIPPSYRQKKSAALAMKNAQYVRTQTLKHRPSTHHQYGTNAGGDNWAIQVGAYTSRARSDQAVMIAQQKLPAHLSHAAPLIAPLKSGDDWIFRARLNGLSKGQAFEACRHLDGCMTIAP
jgi:D-alanyl-D-alanine carboxypeptidase